MNVQVKTNDSQILVFSNIADDSFTVYVSSGTFSGSTYMSHYMSNWTKQFLDNLREVIGGRSSIALLEDAEGNTIKIKVDKLGHVLVTGSIHDYTFPNQQILQFNIETDQTCLQPLAHDLEMALGSKWDAQK